MVGDITMVFVTGLVISSQDPCSSEDAIVNPTEILVKHSVHFEFSSIIPVFVIEPASESGNFS